MKLWRKLAKKNELGVSDGRQIKQQLQMSEMMTKQSKMTYPLLEVLFKKAGIEYALTKKQQEALKTMLAEQAAKDEVLVPELVEQTNATI